MWNTKNVMQLQTLSNGCLKESTAYSFMCIGSALSNAPLIWGHTDVELGSMPNTRLKKVTESAKAKVYIDIKTVWWMTFLSQELISAIIGEVEQLKTGGKRWQTQTLMSTSQRQKCPHPLNLQLSTFIMAAFPMCSTNTLGTPQDGCHSRDQGWSGECRWQISVASNSGSDQDASSYFHTQQSQTQTHLGHKRKNSPSCAQVFSSR
jgi:hypothetical protein